MKWKPQAAGYGGHPPRGGGAQAAWRGPALACIASPWLPATAATR